jgi:hypothetical protein
MLDNFSQKEKKSQKAKSSNTNPLFAQPQNAPKSAQPKAQKKRIRV